MALKAKCTGLLWAFKFKKKLVRETDDVSQQGDRDRETKRAGSNLRRMPT